MRATVRLIGPRTGTLLPEVGTATLHAEARVNRYTGMRRAILFGTLPESA